MELNGRVAIVTGGAVRIGRSIAQALVRAGVAVCVHYGRSARPAEDLLEEIRAEGGRAIAVAADLRRPLESAELVLERTLSEWGRADFLINSAAIFESGPFSTCTEEEWDRHLAINLKAPAFLSQRFAACRQPGERAQIVNIADWRALRPGPDYVAYTLSKSGLVTLTQALAQEWAPEIQVNAIALGSILPPPGKDRAYMEERARQIPLRHSGTPDEVAETVLFLLRSDFLTGEILHLTGGEHL